MSDSHENIRSKLEQFEPPVTPSVAEMKRFNESLDLMGGHKSIFRYWWVLLLLLLLISNFWLLFQNRISNERLIKQVALTEQANKYKATSEKDSRKIFSVIETMDSIKNELKNLRAQNNKLIENVASLEVETAKNRKSAFGKANGLANRFQTSNYTFSSNTKNSKTDKNLENDKTELAASNVGAKNEISKASETIKKAKKKLILDSTAMDSFKNDIIGKIAEERSKEAKVEQITNPVQIAWHLGIGLQGALLNTYFVNARTPVMASVFGGFTANRFGFNGGLAFQYLTYNDVSTQNLRAEVDEIGDIPENVIADAEELYSQSYSFIMPFNVTYNLGNGSFYSSLGTSFHLYSFQNFKIEGRNSDFLVDKLHPEIQFFNYRLGLGSSFDVGKIFSFNYEGGFTFGNPNFDLLMRERSGVYLKINLLYR